MKPQWYWEWQDYGPPRYIRARWWHFACIGAVLALWVTFMGLALRSVS